MPNFRLPVRSLAGYLSRLPGVGAVTNAIRGVDRGSGEDLLTPQAKRFGREKIITDTHDISVGDEVDPRLVELEEEETSKAGIRSIRLPWDERRETLIPYWDQPGDFDPDIRLLEQAFELELNAILRGTIRPISLEESVRRSPKNTNLGLPHLRRDQSLVEEYMERAADLSDANEIHPNFAWWRGKPVGLGKPIDPGRIVFGADHVETFAGGRILHPLLGVMRKLPEHAAWNGPDDVDRVIDAYIRPFVHNHPGRTYISVDFSGFDTSVRETPLRRIFQWLREKFPTIDRLVSILEEFFITSGIITPDGWVYGRKGSVPSGSVLTNAIDSIWNRVVIRYSALKRRAEIRYTVQGDDALIGGTLRLEDFAEDSAELGMTVSDDKSLESDNTAHYLQRLYLMDLGRPGIASISRRASALTGYERFARDWDEWKEAMRVLMLLEVCKQHDNHTQFVQYVASLDNVLGKVDPATIAKRAGDPELVLRSVDRAWEGSGYDRRNLGLESFRTVRVLRELGR